jgi:hypothetical protein
MFAVLVSIDLVIAPEAIAQPAAPVTAGPSTQAAPRPPAVEPFVRNWTRIEGWRYFEPAPSTPAAPTGDPTTGHIGNRLLAGIRLRRGPIDSTLALQYVQFGGLPSDAIGPGALGTGALYFDHSGDSSSRQLYLKTASVAFRNLWGHLDLQAGRMGYTSGAERPSGNAKIEAVKRQRLDSRLVGEFEWSLYQRSFDGVRADWNERRFRITGAALQPTQGGFEDAAGVSMSNVRVLSAILTTAPGVVMPRSELQVFVHRYDDTRDVTARPDNTGRRATAVDIGITTLGAHIVGSRPLGSGELDGLLWTAGQFGSWYEQDHRAMAVVVEGGYQWPKARWSPWLRAGVNWFSGDGVADDDRHGTFFPMLPTVRRYSQSTLYSMANLRDFMVQAILRPRGNVTLRVDGHFLGLASRDDGWYAGSGATQESGRIFGYTLRPSGRESRLMEVAEGSIDWRITSRWSINGYVGVASRGPVVRTSFVEGPAAFTYFENVVQF